MRGRAVPPGATAHRKLGASSRSPVWGVTVTVDTLCRDTLGALTRLPGKGQAGGGAPAVPTPRVVTLLEARRPRPGK